MSSLVDVAIVGAGPYGLSIARHLRGAGVEALVYGEPMSFWENHMPVGMFLRSSWDASQIGERIGELALETYQVETGASFSSPIPLVDFVSYGKWFQQRAVPDVDRRRVVHVAHAGGCFSLELDDGDRVNAGRVIVAAGIGPFATLPAEVEGLPSELASHSSAHRDLGVFAGRSVLVVGGGQSALESAALAHEAGASVEVVLRGRGVVWLRGGTTQRRLGRAKPLFYAPTDVGPLGISRILSCIDLSRRLPRALREPMERRAIRPAGSRWLVDRLQRVPITTQTGISGARSEGDRVRVRLHDGTSRLFDHVLCGTGYGIDINRYEFLGRNLVASVSKVDGYPRLRTGLESSVDGLHFVGAPAAWSFGPVMRFVSGTWYTCGAVAHAIIASGPRARRQRTVLNLA